MGYGLAEQPERKLDGAHEHRGSPLAAHLKARLAIMHPAYFALAMATGIVAIACHLLGLVEFAVALAWINVAAYPTLWVLLMMRAVMFRERFIADWADHGRAPGFFTIVAATGVLGSQAVLLHGAIVVAQILWWACVALWAVCTYTIFAVLTVRGDKPSLAEGINGGWLVAVVATQSVCVLGCTLDGAVLGDRDTALFVLMAFWLGGGMLYLWIIGLIFYRYMFFRFSPRDLMPPYWINMGAVAISTLAGALLASAAESSALLAPMHPFILGLTVMFWATATWWIPMLLVLGIWRHRMRGVRLSYDPLYWGLVFPVGMYSACTFRLAGALGVPFLVWIARVFVIAAAAVWLLTFLGLARRILYAVLLGLRRPHLPHVERGDGSRSTSASKAGGITQMSGNSEPSVVDPSKAEVYAKAEQRMRRGKRLVIGGFVISVLGIVGYCVACFSAAVSPELGSTFLRSPRWLVGPALGVIGLGTLLWLVGSFVYLNGAMDSDPDSPDLYY